MGDDFGAVRLAWVRGASLAEVSRWLSACYPGRLATLDDAALPSSMRDLELRASQEGSSVRLHLSAHEAGFVHELALAACRDGHPVLVVDGGAFESPTGWLAFTEYRDLASPPRTIWFDLVRFPPVDLDVAAGWLGTYAGFHEGVEAFALKHQAFVYDAERWALREEGSLLPAPKPLPKDSARAYQPSPAVSTFVNAVTMVLAVVLLGPISLALPIFVLAAFSAAMGEGVAAALVTSLVCGAGGALLSLLPISWPNGAAISRGARLFLFATPPVVTPLAWYWSHR